MTEGRTLDDPLAEATRLVALAETAGLQVRLLGGLAFHAQVPSWRAAVERPRRDIDVATRSQDRKAVSELLVQEGYTPDRRYNALHGHKQLYFVDARKDRPVDILVDRLEMCHRFDFGDRLDLDPLTLPLADLLLSKLQIVKINRKDLLDLLILLREHELGNDDAGRISVARITGLTSGDWGWWRTVTGNLRRLMDFAASEVLPHDLDTGHPPRHDETEQLQALFDAIGAAPKSISWRLRARLGDRAPWYDEPEEIGHGD